MEKRQGKTFGPPGREEDARLHRRHLHARDERLGRPVTNEIVRQLLEQGGMYSLEKPIGDMKMIIDCQYLAAMNTPGGGKNDIPNRLKRHFAIFNVPLPSVAAINNIFGQLVAGRFSADVFARGGVDAAGSSSRSRSTCGTKSRRRCCPRPRSFTTCSTCASSRRCSKASILAERDRFKLGVDAAAVSAARSLPGRVPGGAVAARVRARVLRQAHHARGQGLGRTSSS